MTHGIVLLTTKIWKYGLMIIVDLLSKQNTTSLVNVIKLEFMQ